MLTHIFSTLDGTKTSTGYLWDKTGYPEVLDSVIFKHTKEAKHALSTKTWNSFAQALEFANVDEKRAYKGLSAANPLQRADSNLVDFRIMAVKVDKIKENAFKEGLLLVDTIKKHVYDVSNANESPYQEKTIFLASLSHQTVFGKTVYFKIDESLLMDTVCGDSWCDQSEFFFCIADCGNPLPPIEILPIDPKDPCDDVVEVDIIIPSQNCGDVALGSGNGRTGCTIRNGDELIAAAKWNYEIAPRRNFTYRRHGSNNNLNNLVRAGAYIFLSNDNILNRPVILVDGYTNLDLCGYSAVGERAGTFNEFANELLNRGYDVIYLNYEYMGNYIENNAAVLRELLVDVNEAKLQNAVEYGVSIEQNVVLGYSMGGAITRYELTRMETENVAHDTRLYVSMDTPHKGANVPLGIQYFASDANAILNTLPSYMPTLVQPFTNLIFGIALGLTNSNLNLNVLTNNATLILWQPLNIKTDYLNQILNDHSAQQLIKYHVAFDATRPNPEYEALQAEFRRMGNILGNTGYPTQCEKIAIINGDVNGRPTINAGGSLGLFNNTVRNASYRYGFRFLDFEANLARISFGLELGKEFLMQLSFSGQQGTAQEQVSFVRMRKWWIGLIRDDATFEHKVIGRPDYDFAPGSFIRQDVERFDVDLTDVIDDLFEARLDFAPDHFTFVPSVSAADINMPDGNHDSNFYLNYNLAGNATYPQIVNLNTFNVVDRNRCPFDRIYPRDVIVPNNERGGRDFGNVGHGSFIILRPNIEDPDLDGVFENRFIDNHFPVIPNSLTEFYNLNASDIIFQQEDIRTSCTRQDLIFNLVLNNSTTLVNCSENTRYTWISNGNVLERTNFPQIVSRLPIPLVPTNPTITNPLNTIEVIIEKLDDTGTWVQVAIISDTYRINYVEPPFDCNGSEAGMGKIAVKDKEEINSDVILYPNPAKTEFSIKTSMKVEKIIISNSLGQVLLTTDKKKTISIESFSIGIYFVTIILQDGEVKIQKLIIN